MEKVIKAAIDRGASDLHIKAGDVFRARINGTLVPLTKQRLTPEQTKAIALRLIPNDEDRARIDRVRDYDCSWGMPGVGRFRVNILRQRSSFMIVMRVIPFDVPTFDSLKLPPILASVAVAERGMILVTGVTGSGKSSTMAAMVNHINQTQNKHIVTLENPIEFLHRDINCSVTQREIGVDTDDFRAGLRAAMRQDPDVVLIGEMRDAETIDTAMKAAETGHLVISTLHTPDVLTTVSRVVSMFPPEEQEVARLRLCDALQAVVSQRLLPRADGGGRGGDVRDGPRREHESSGIREAAALRAPPLAHRHARGGDSRPVTERQLAGVLAPITTPFDSATGEVAPVHLRHNVTRLVAAGLDGVVVGGSTGESALLDPDEQRRMVAWVREVLPGKRWLIAGTGGESTRQAVALTRAAATEGADAVLVRPPAYFSAAVSPASLADYYRAVADASPVPVLVYNIPKYTHLPIAAGLLRQLAAHANIVGVKDSSGDAKNLAAYRDAAPEWSVFVGSGSLLYAALELGCDGGILAVACFAAALCAQVFAAFRAGDREGAGRLQERLAPLDREVVGKLGPAGVKAAMDAVGGGLYGGPVRPPLAPVAASDREQVVKLVAT